MSKFTSNQHGFGAVEAIAVVTIIALVGLTSWYVWHVKQSANKSFTSSEASPDAQAAEKDVTQSSSKALIIQAVKAYKDNAGSVTPNVTVKAIKGDNAYGIVGFTGQDGGGKWLAHKTSGTWTVISQGSAGFCKDEIQQYNLPTSWEPKPIC